jgi:O-antigen/teichoic acid export membrane protein
MLGIMVPIIAVGYLFAPQIILWIYGSNYAPAIDIMKPMWIAFGINAIVRIPLGNILAALGMLKFNIILSAVISALHLVLDYLFISTMGISGAAYALMISYAVSSACSVVYLFAKRERA